MQLTELKFYTNNIISCLGIADLISARTQDNQLYTLINCATIFTIKLFKNHKNIQQDSDH